MTAIATKHNPSKIRLRKRTNKSSVRAPATSQIAKIANAEKIILLDATFVKIDPALTPKKTPIRLKMEKNKPARIRFISNSN